MSQHDSSGSVGVQVHEVLVNSDNERSVIFLHGLDGSWDKTWGFDRSPNWAAWINEAKLKADVISVFYPCASSASRGKALPLYDRSVSILAALAAKGILSRPFVLVGHSMGGLVIKQMARVAEQSTLYRGAFDQCRGVVFLATPHTGSALATWATFLAYYLGANIPVAELELYAAPLRDLNAWFRSFAIELPVQVCYETLKIGPTMVVDVGSADPGIAGVIPIPIEANHINIQCPKSRNDETAVIILGTLDQFFKRASNINSKKEQDRQKVNINTVHDVKTDGAVRIIQIYAPDKSDFS